MAASTGEVTSPSQGGEVLCLQQGSEVQGPGDGFEVLFLDRSSTPYGERIFIAGTRRTAPPLTPFTGHCVPASSHGSSVESLVLCRVLAL